MHYTKSPNTQKSKGASFLFTLAGHREECSNFLFNAHVGSGETPPERNIGIENDLLDLNK
jgi:hypothetical protein